MGKRRIIRIWDVPSGGIYPALLFLAASFLLGTVIGFGLAAYVAGGGGESLAQYIRDYLAVARDGAMQPAPLLPLVWETVRWSLFAVILGFTAIGVLGLPVVFAVRGFLLSFAVSSFVRMFGATGFVLAFVVFGITAMITLPVLFVLGVQSFMASQALVGRLLGGSKNAPLFAVSCFSRCSICAGLLAFSVLLELVVVPTLLSALAAALPG